MHARDLLGRLPRGTNAVTTQTLVFGASRYLDRNLMGLFLMN
jgi:hypothetical protein